ncbi:hypothetical protein [Symbioplanes lichenis]|uniref:hypothetical protein n=1 Tax=Symbioplanes lichenis TaxID=1629072 RepID=UPI00273A2646|nr:hypothetical protein [Actinoplanes lichenis]
MSEISLEAALRALVDQIGRGVPRGAIRGPVRVDLTVAVTGDAGDARWELSSSGQDNAHRISLILAVPDGYGPAAAGTWEAADRSAPIPYGDLPDETPIGESPGGPYDALPPIVRPKPGVKDDRDN